ncbi:hypothetical protein BTA51_28800 [Hahella sp. CCB-MM4]|uniref:DUF4240 domain-containing protein n=1 Tax=Hahella sp. (strain CCB-MM4) TaxID=1926491 RepID=UPI000B9B9F03|nr:DUF4240 domain-containing protein [Hahella sp. CCB-MM4]OZG69899.1 hypothetical protein BTA51_28800 [Hahella sp. CCB-MM4]
MSENEFWSIIGMLNWEESGDDEAVVEPVVDFLSQKSDEEIFQFEEILAQKLHALDTKAHAKEIGEDAYVNEKEYFSVDGFLYSRCVVVANGKELFQHILENPKEFPKDMEFEAILYVAQEAYEQKNDKEWEYVSPTDYETYKNISGWQ